MPSAHWEKWIHRQTNLLQRSATILSFNLAHFSWTTWYMVKSWLIVTWYSLLQSDMRYDLLRYIIHYVILYITSESHSFIGSTADVSISLSMGSAPAAWAQLRIAWKTNVLCCAPIQLLSSNKTPFFVWNILQGFSSTLPNHKKLICPRFMMYRILS